MEEKIKIISVLNKGHIFLDQLLKRCNISKKILIECLEQLVNDNIVYHKPNSNIYGLIKTGKVDIKSAGYGFVIVENEEEDYYISPRDLKGVYNGDTISFYPVDEDDKHLCARTIKVIDRAHKTIIGKYKRKTKKGTSRCYIASNNPDFNVKAHTINDPNIEDGMIVVGELKYHGDNTIHAKIIEVLGKPNTPGIEISQIALEYGFNHNFSEEVEAELSTISDIVTKEDKVGRYDFTDRLIFTIDGDDSKDFDDAVNVKKLSNGNYKLSVHIADVSHYVKEASAIDKEALNRGTSIYLVDRVIPMLPEKLSNGICSLNEGVVRLVLSCVMEIDPSGKMIDSSILSGYIKSKYRMTYSNVNKILEQEDEKLINKYSDIYDMLLDMKELSRILRKKRTARGSLDFDVKEMKICVDETGKPINILARDRGLAEMLIEDFMLEANETVAQTLYHLQYPCCYRVHEEPNKEKLNNVNNILKNIGYKIPNIDKGVRPMAIQSVMNKIKGSDSEDAINTMLLRAMAKARYDSRSLGHYGLAAEFYCHFTSPIRRYPDLQTHRMINNLIIKPHNFESKITHYQAILDYICERSSECERKSIDLERLVDDMKAAEYMENKIGNIYNGIISSVTSFGFFVMLDNTIEGLVHIKNLPDFYVYDEKKATLSGNYSKEVYNIGDTVKVRLIGASKENRQIDFMVVSHSKKRGL